MAPNTIGPATQCDGIEDFAAILRILEASQVSPPELQQCGQSATHDGLFSYSPAMFIAAMAIINCQLTISGHILHERELIAHHYAENCV